MDEYTVAAGPQHNPDDEAFLFPRPAVKLQMLQPEGKSIEQCSSVSSKDMMSMGTCFFQSGERRQQSTSVVQHRTLLANYLSQMTVSVDARLEVSPLATALCGRHYPRQSDTMFIADSKEPPLMSLCNKDYGQSVRILSDSQRVAHDTAQRILRVGPFTAAAQQRESEVQRGYVHRQLLHRLLDKSKINQ
eukprot:SAG31_NODE_3011_length_4788_cov_5.207080_3_plen_190_part_00